MNDNTGYNNTGCSNTGNYNTGNNNTGYSNTSGHNTGSYNAGYSNAGDCNTGYSNTGYRNTGSWNNCNNETGHFNTIQHKMIRVFNNPCLKSAWDKATKPDFLYFELTNWVVESEMTDHEKTDNPTYKETGGYLKKYEYKDAFQKSFNKCDNQQKQIDQLRVLPNFDANVFFEISGIDIKNNGKVKVEANGKIVYISKESAKELGL